MADRPIIFSAPMVSALLDGRKTQTRRVFVPPAPFAPEDDITIELATGSIKPRWQARDRLYVREAWSHDGPDLETVRSRHEDALGGGIGYGPYYRATETAPDTLSWRPSIHMPRWASRLTLMVTEVRVERLNAMSAADAIAEGIQDLRTPDHSDFGIPGLVNAQHPVRAFWLLWDHINGEGSWLANPWVAAISFTVHHANIDALSMERAA